MFDWRGLMFLLRFIHAENKLYVGDRPYQATCKVRNELNGWREKDQVVKTYPLVGEREPYHPRKFPTGSWKVKRPEWTKDPEYKPVKILTDAFRRVFLWETDNQGYKKLSGEHQTDAFYHLHFAEKSSTTLGCIRLNSAKDATKIAKQIEDEMDKGNEVWIEVIASKE